MILKLLGRPDEYFFKAELLKEVNATVRAQKMNLESAADADGVEDLANIVNDKDDLIDLFARANINSESADGVEDIANTVNAKADILELITHPNTPNDIKFSVIVKFPLSILLKLIKSKTVMDLISNSAFTEKRSQQSVFLNMKNGYCLVDPHQDPPHQIMNFSYPFDAYREDEVEVVGATYGLILLEHGLVYNLKTYWILNPITKRFKRLSIPCPNFFFDSCASGFGYDAGTDTLKYVRLNQDHCPCTPYCSGKWIGVLNIKTNAWTTVGHTHIPFEIKRNMFTNRLATYFNGSLYWQYNKRYVFSLNVETLVSTISEQLIPSEVNVCNFGFGVVEKKLCLFVGVILEPKFMIWRLESDIWSLYSSFVVRFLETLKPLCLWNDGRLIFRQAPGCRLFLYDDKNCSRKYLDIDCSKFHYGRTRALVFDDSFMLNSSSGGELVKKETVEPKVPFHVLFAYCGNPYIQAAEAIFSKLVKDGNMSSKIEIDFAVPFRNDDRITLARENDNGLINPIMWACDRRSLEIKSAPRLLDSLELSNYELILIISKDKKKSLVNQMEKFRDSKMIPRKTMAKVKSFGVLFDKLKADNLNGVTDYDKVLNWIEKRCKYMLDWILKSNC